MTRTAMIWGADGGIGRALTAALIDNGWQVAAISRRGDSDARTAATAQADFTDEQAINEAVYLTALEIAPVDLWVYAAGDIVSHSVAEMSAAEWQRVIGANLTGAYLTTRHSLPLMSDEAHLMYLGAFSERLRLPGLSAYAAAKAGLEAFTDALRKEQRHKRITLVRPSAVDTPFWSKVPMKLPASAVSAETVSRRIIEAYEQGSTGFLDLM